MSQLTRGSQLTCRGSICPVRQASKTRTRLSRHSQLAMIHMYCICIHMYIHTTFINSKTKKETIPLNLAGCYSRRIPADALHHLEKPANCNCRCFQMENAATCWNVSVLLAEDETVSVSGATSWSGEMRKVPERRRNQKRSWFPLGRGWTSLLILLVTPPSLYCSSMDQLHFLT